MRTSRFVVLYLPRWSHFLVKSFQLPRVAVSCLDDSAAMRLNYFVIAKRDTDVKNNLRISTRVMLSSSACAKVSSSRNFRNRCFSCLTFLDRYKTTDKIQVGNRCVRPRRGLRKVRVRAATSGATRHYPPIRDLKVRKARVF